jgi:hypothetical protein
MMRQASWTSAWLRSAGACVTAATLITAEQTPAESSWWTRERKALVVNVALDGGVLVYGIGNWDWGSSDFSSSNEGWFGADTKFGGSDKAGHAYTGYLVSELLADRYAAWGYDDSHAALMGAGSSALFTTLIEAGDGFSSEYGFSREDFAMNLFGAALSYMHRLVPSATDLIDFRIEYIPSDAIRSGREQDVVTDYDGMRHLFAFKLGGLPACRGTWWRFLELHAGYYTRGYDNPAKSDRRVIYGAIGVNLTEVITSLWRRTRVFDYYQMPYTYVPLNHEF